MQTTTSFDRGAAITRSMLGYGVLAGVFFLVFGLTLALTRDGFDLGEHALSLLTLGEHGWLQTLNFVLTGVMVAIAAVGFARAGVGGGVPVLVGVYAVCLVASAIFEPDAMNDFPVPTPTTEVTASGMLHLVFGTIGFGCLAVAAWRSGARSAAAVIVAGFVLGAATQLPLFLWIAVVTGWVWLAVASIAAYRTVPHPDGAGRATHR